MKKIISLLLCAVMLVSMSIYVFAVEETDKNDTGIINAEELQKMFDDYTAQYNMKANGRSFSVGFCYLATGDTWYYNEGKWYYSASLYKVPVSMLLAEREAAGEITQETVFTNQYMTGTLGTLESKAIINSNNDAGHAIVEWMGGTYAGKCADQLKKYADLPDDYYSADFESVSYYNVEFYTQVLRTLYNNPSAYPHVIEYMKQANPNAYLRTYLEGKYEIAQKYGAFEETKTYPPKNNNHAAGIIYTPKPIDETVMTQNKKNYNNRIGEVAQMLSDYALKLDSRLADYNNQKALAAQQEAARAAQEEQERLAAEQAAQNAATAAQAQQTEFQPFTQQSPDTGVSIFVDNSGTSTFEPAPSQTAGTAYTEPSDNKLDAVKGMLASIFTGNDDNNLTMILVIAGAAIFVIGIILLIIALVSRKKSRRDRYDDEYDEYYDDDDYLDPPIVRNSSRQSRKDRYEDDEDLYYGDELYDEEEEEYYDEEDYVEEEPADEEYYDDSADAEEDEFLDDKNYMQRREFLDPSDYDDFRTDEEYDYEEEEDDAPPRKWGFGKKRR